MPDNYRGSSEPGDGLHGNSGAGCPYIFCLQGGGVTSQRSQGSGWNVDVAFTLNGLDRHAVAYERTDSAAKQSERRNDIQ